MHTPDRIHSPTLASASSPSSTWANLLADEEVRIAEQGFDAGIVVVGFAAALLRLAGDDERDLTEAAVHAVVDRHLLWTDRLATIAPGRLGVVVVPIDGTLDLTRRAGALHRELRDRALTADVAYSIRRRTGGLGAAAARADAALDSAVIRRRRRVVG